MLDLCMALLEYTTIQPRVGGLVHATCLYTPNRTACGRLCGGWRIVPEALTCKTCEDSVAAQVERKRKSQEG